MVGAIFAAWSQDGWPFPCSDRSFLAPRVLSCSLRRWETSSREDFVVVQGTVEVDCRWVVPPAASNCPTTWACFSVMVTCLYFSVFSLFCPTSINHQAGLVNFWNVWQTLSSIPYGLDLMLKHIGYCTLVLYEFPKQFGIFRLPQCSRRLQPVQLSKFEMNLFCSDDSIMYKEVLFAEDLLKQLYGNMIPIINPRQTFCHPDASAHRRDH
jgi:hypothetical protein